MENRISSIKYSIICPLFNEEGNVKELHKRILAGLKELNGPGEIIFVDDGSSDRTYSHCEELKPLRLISFRRNFGQTAALDCGIKAARGEIIITLDGDLQNDPRDFKKLVEKIEEGYDVVSGWRKERKDPLSKRIISKGAESLRKILINDGIHDSGCTLKAYRAVCFKNVDLYGEMHRFIPAILKIQGFQVTEVPVNHYPRLSGITKYTWTRTVKGFLDMISVWFWKKYANRPLHLFGGLGILFSLIGLIIFVFLVYVRLFWGIGLSDKIWPLIAVFMILTGIQFLISGLMADIAVKSYYNGKRSYYSIKNEKENLV